MVTLDVDTVAARLEALEETIISKLIDRAQFRVNALAYEPGSSGFIGESKRSLFLLRLAYQERMDARFGRFCVPEERPFTARLPTAKRVVQLPQSPLAIDNFNHVNLTSRIVSEYQGLIARICAPGDDGQYGSSVEHDVYAIQAISRRIHYGAFYVAEGKFRSDPDRYRDAVRRGDRERLMAMLTRNEIEERIIARVREKVRHAQAAVNATLRIIIAPDAVLRFYRDVIIPLTKEGEIRYLLNRHDGDN